MVGTATPMGVSAANMATRGWTTLQDTYGDNFAAGVWGDARLRTVLDRSGAPSLVRGIHSVASSGALLRRP